MLDQLCKGNRPSNKIKYIFDTIKTYWDIIEAVQYMVDFLNDIILIDYGVIHHFDMKRYVI